MIVTIIGARPQFVKAAVLSAELCKQDFREFVVHTGQHYDYKMSEVFFEELGLQGADVNLNIGSRSHGLQTAEMLVGIEKILLDKKNEVDYVLLYGDTNSTLAGALAASKLSIPIIHVEAGLRSFNRQMPEEVNRILTDHLSSLLFCSSDLGKKNLSNEGIKDGVHIVGDIMLDAFTVFSAIADKKVKLVDIIPAELVNDYSLLTLHRPTNTDAPENLNQIMEALAEMKTNIIWPVHPRNKSKMGETTIPQNVHIFEPFSYFEMMQVLGGSQKVITDSGGLQKEAYWAKKPCITVRTETEWVETLHNNWNIFTGPNKQKITEAALTVCDRSTWKNLYGNGNTAEKIVKIIAAHKHGV